MAGRQLTIKTNVLLRTIKELASYKEETLMLQSRYEAMEAREEDEYEVRQQKRVHADSMQMIPDTEKRLAKAIVDLSEMIESSESLQGTEEMEKAIATLKTARA